MKSRAQQRRFELASWMADETLRSLLGAREQGTMLAWALRHHREDRDVVAEAWRAATNHGLMLELLDMIGRTNDELISALYRADSQAHETGTRNRGLRFNGCVQCSNLMRRFVPTITLDDVAGSPR